VNRPIERVARHGQIIVVAARGCLVTATRARVGILAAALLWLGSLAYAQGWDIPSGASTEKNPISPTAAVLNNGKALYASQCAKCHGPEGRGDGPDKTNDLAHRPADLTSAFRARFNPDGVLFYRIWNGRTQPTMPAFRTKLTRSEVWAIVEYVKTLRKPPVP
jgi:mono/diheme cytochrome c family protein